MARIQYDEVDNWPDLSLRIDDYFTYFNSYIFRGQANSKWKLESTLARSLKKNYKKVSDKQMATAEHFRLFKENIRGRTSLNLDSASEDEIWALGQHFGLNTPLLDWSRSPYVALFFALHGNCPSGKRVLWAIVDSDIESINEGNKNAKKKVNIVNPLTHYNDRLVTQRGLFLNVPINVDVEKWVENGEEQEWVTMYKIVFPDSIRNEALSALNNKNINHLSLFPDLQGSSLYTNYLLDIEPYLETERQRLWDE